VRRDVTGSVCRGVNASEPKGHTTARESDDDGMSSIPENQTKPRICFVAHYAYGAMAGGDGGHIGGVERQMSLMARRFARRGYPVSLVTWDEGQDDGVIIDGVQIFKMCRLQAGWPGLRFFWPRWTSLASALKRADADVYYHNCGEYITGQVALWCRKHHRRFVYSVASDPDCDPKLPVMRTFRERALYRYGLTHADVVIVQTNKQQEMLQTHFKKESVIIPMPCAGPSDQEYQQIEAERTRSNRVLWIGRLCEVKRLDRFLDLAEACPSYEFDVVGPEDGSELTRRHCVRAEGMANVTLHGPASLDRVSRFYRNASVLCCTSDYEGFPNTFLEAWSHGVPVVSTVDPDGLIVRKGLGAVGSDVSGLADGLGQMLDSPDRWREASQSAREYYVENHAVEHVMDQFASVFGEATGMGPDTAGDSL